jgi:uncharacterized pyridoxal phosphate-containing UPF0001 family protein
VRLLAGLGLTDIGENRDAEAAGKAAECADLGLTWHFVGQLQTNKCRSVAGYADVVHSVDRPHLVRVLARAARSAQRLITCLVQVSLNDADSGLVAPRGGARPDQVTAIADQVTAEEGLRLGGVMAVAPLDVPPLDAFLRLADVAAQVRAAHRGATVISAGMTADLEEAIQAGATHVRVGTALLGARHAFVR